MPKVTEEHFRTLLESKLGTQWKRALCIFQKCGEHISFEVTCLLSQAVTQGKVSKVLDELNTHYRNHLQFQKPEKRGLISKKGLNITTEVLSKISRTTLGISPRA